MDENTLKYYYEKIVSLDLELEEVCGHELDLRIEKLKVEKEIEELETEIEEAKTDAKELKLLSSLKHGTSMSVLVPSGDLAGTVQFSPVDVYKYIMELKGEEINM